MPVSRTLKTIAYAAGFAGCGLFILLGQTMAQKNEKTNAKAKEARQAELKVVDLRPPRKVLEVVFTSTTPQRSFDTGYHGNLQTMKIGQGWSFLETKDWALVNSGLEGATVCPEALTEFMQAAVRPDSIYGGRPPRVSWEAINRYATQLHNKTGQVQVRVPTFSGKPANLDRCIDMDWDSATKMLTLRGKPVAVMEPSQPLLDDLVAAPRR